MEMDHLGIRRAHQDVIQIITINALVTTNAVRIIATIITVRGLWEFVSQIKISEFFKLF